jgi:AraC family transcriptional regulator, transcriptional activator of pobA
MITNETLQDFYQTHPAARKLPKLPDFTKGIKGHFNVFSREFCSRYTAFSRRDYYKISLIIGKGRLYYDDREIEIDQNALIFFNRNVPYAWENISEVQTGFFCLFSEDFFIPETVQKADDRSLLLYSDTIPVYFINQDQEEFLKRIFTKMRTEMESDYIHKHDLLRTYVNLIIHEGLKMQPSGVQTAHINGSSRIAGLFIDLLERQFPIDSPENKLELRTAKDYAVRLSVHVNHLNRALKEVTGKTTTELILERVIHQAKLLLRQSNWSIAEIAYCLGFEYAAYFNNLFKKQTGFTPKSYRD